MPATHPPCPAPSARLQQPTRQKPRPDGLALAFQERKPGQSRHEAVITARPGLAYFGLAWPGSRPQAGPSTALVEVLGNGLMMKAAHGHACTYIMFAFFYF